MLQEKEEPERALQKALSEMGQQNQLRITSSTQKTIMFKIIVDFTSRIDSDRKFTALTSEIQQINAESVDQYGNQKTNRRELQFEIGVIIAGY